MNLEEAELKTFDRITSLYKEDGGLLLDFLKSLFYEKEISKLEKEHAKMLPFFSKLSIFESRLLITENVGKIRKFHKKVWERESLLKHRFNQCGLITTNDSLPRLLRDAVAGFYKQNLERLDSLVINIDTLMGLGSHE